MYAQVLMFTSLRGATAPQMNFTKALTVLTYYRTRTLLKARFWETRNCILFCIGICKFISMKNGYNLETKIQGPSLSVSRSIVYFQNNRCTSTVLFHKHLTKKYKNCAWKCFQIRSRVNHEFALAIVTKWSNT